MVFLYKCDYHFYSNVTTITLGTCKNIEVTIIIVTCYNDENLDTNLADQMPTEYVITVCMLRAQE